MCTQLGYDTVSTVYSHHLCSPVTSFISNISCAGIEVSIAMCDIATINYNESNYLQTVCAISCASESIVLHVKCYIKVSLDSLNVRLSAQGVLSIYYDREWLPVCAETISQSEVYTVCRELGYQSGDQSTPYFIDPSDNSKYITWTI